MTDQPFGSNEDASAPLPSSQNPPPPPVPPANGGATQWFENIAIVVIALLCCWPLGLVLVWMNKKWTTKTKWIITGVMIGIAVIGIAISAIASSSASNSVSGTEINGGSVQASSTTAEKATTSSTQKPTTTTTAKATTTTTAPTNSPKISKAEFDQLQEGMSREQVAAIVGSPGEIMSETNLGGFNTVMVTWEGSGTIGANANAMFQNNKLISKAQFGLK